MSGRLRRPGLVQLSAQRPVTHSATGYPWSDGDTLFAADLNDAIAGAASTGGATDFSGLTGQVTYAQLPAEVAQVPIAFVYIGNPATGALVNIPMVMALAVPTALAGTQVYAGTVATGNPIFTVNKLVGGVTAVLGTITIVSGSHTNATFTGFGGSLAIGDVMQIVAPTQDATLADLGITILAMRI